MVTLVFSPFKTIAQINEVTKFYTSEWKVTTKEKASFFRVFKTRKNGKPLGRIMNYYITGELYGIVDSAFRIDNFNDSNSIFIGDFHCYNKAGSEIKTVRFDENGEINIYAAKNEKGVFEDWYIKSKDESNNYYISHRRSYYRNGQISADYYFPSPDSSIETTFDTSGNLLSIKRYKNSKANGKYEVYHYDKDGDVIIFETGYYKDNKLLQGSLHYIKEKYIIAGAYNIWYKNGTWYKYDETAKKILSVLQYKNDVLLSEQDYNPSVSTSKESSFVDFFINLLGASSKSTPNNSDGSNSKVWITCPVCNGGKYFQITSPGGYTDSYLCSRCYGSGLIED